MIDLLTLVRNHVFSHTDLKGFTFFYRFTKKQLKVYNRDAMFRFMSKSTAGITLSFLTTGTALSLECKKKALIKELIPAMKAMGFSKIITMIGDFAKQAKQYGGRLTTEDGFDLLIDGQLSSSVKLKNGVLKFDLNNPDKKTRNVQLYLPLYYSVGIKDLTCDGDILPLTTCNEYFLCLGDSITQGFLAGGPSFSFVAQLSRELGYDALNQGVGGYPYEAESLPGLKSLKAPSFVIVAYGTNDWHREQDLSSLRQHVRDYYNVLQTIYSTIPIYVITPIWRGDMDTPQPCGTFAEMIVVIEEESCIYENIILIDGLAISPHDASFYTDGWLHPNKEGFEIITKNLLPLLPRAKESIQMENEHPSSYANHPSTS